MKMMKILSKIPMIVIRFFISVIKSGLNERNIFQLAFNFFLNFSPVAIWLAIFKNAGLIPNEIRPEIHVRLAYDWDLKMFAATSFFFWLLVAAAFTYVWYLLVQRCSNYYKDPIASLLKVDEESIELTNKVYFDEDDEDSVVDELEDDDNEINFSGSSSSLIQSDDSAYSTDDESNSKGSRVIPINKSRITRTHLLYITPILFFSIWPILNIDHYFAQGLKTSKDLTAWFFYVLGHITFPILTAVWLYVFHPQGALKCFSMALGTQNILGVITHLLFPNAPPWFIHLYGPDSDANYDMPGYAAGLTRVDTALGTHLHSKGFHKSPIVFGAFPSLHSAMAFQVCLFILYFGRSTALQICAVLFVVIQWWATIYLDHHFRIDLIGGVVYALFAFALVYPFILKKEKEFIMARLNGDFKKGSSMGMRVFKKNKKIQKFFDPYR